MTGIWAVVPVKAFREIVQDALRNIQAALEAPRFSKQTFSGCDVMMVGKHEEKLALVQQRGIKTYLLKDVARILPDGGRRVDMVVECTGSAEGLELAMRLVRPRGTIILKSTC